MFSITTFMRTMLSFNKINDLKIGDEKGDFNCDTVKKWKLVQN